MIKKLSLTKKQGSLKKTQCVLLFSQVRDYMEEIEYLLEDIDPADKDLNAFNKAFTELILTAPYNELSQMVVMQQKYNKD